MSKPQNVDEYIESFHAPAQERLRDLRALSLAHAPGATESLKWGQPAYSLDAILFVFAGYQQHANLVFTPSTREAFDDALVDFTTGKGSVRLPYADPLPADLLGEMIDYRVREFRERGVLWR